MRLDCNVVLDLIPLVKDKVASLKSEELVLEHINSCEGCKLEYNTFNSINGDEDNSDDKKIIEKIKKSIYISQIALIILGSALGIALTNSNNVYYNFLIIPIVGAISVIKLKKKFYLTPLSLFIISSLITFISTLSKEGINKYNLFNSLVYGLIYVMLVLVGALVAILLRFAFKKEENL